MPGAFLCHGLAIGFTSPGLPACLKHHLCGIVNIPENVSEVLQRNIPDNRSKKSHPVRIGRDYPKICVNLLNGVE